VLEEAIRAAAAMNVVVPGSQVVCVQRIHDDFCVKIVAVNERGDGLLAANRASSMAF
jgi:pyruvate kinase